MGSPLHNLVDLHKGQHACKGHNDCKVQRGCNTGDNGCKGKTPAKARAVARLPKAAARAKTAAPPAEASRDWPFTEGWDKLKPPYGLIELDQFTIPFPGAFMPGFNLLALSERGPSTTNDQTILM
jgi:hypothetical protein